MKDRELVTLAKKDDAYKGELYFRYEKLCYKHLHILERQLNHKLNVQDDFMGDTYEVFLKALEAVKLDSIKNDKWLFLGWYGFYLKNLRIKYMNDIVKQSSNETSLYKTGGDGTEYAITDVAGIHAPDVYEKIDEELAYESAFENLSIRQKKIATMRINGFNNSEIAKIIEVSNTLITFEMKHIKEVIQEHM